MLAAETNINADGGLVSVIVEKTLTHTLLPSGLTSHGRLVDKSGKAVNFIAPNEEISLHVLAGRTTDGNQPVVAFVGPEGAASKQGAKVQVSQSTVVARPSSLTLEDATIYPFHAVSLLPPLMKAGIQNGEGSSGPASSKVCIVTGCGASAVFAIQVLKAWGCRVVGCSRRNMDLLRQAGAEAVVDSSKESFSERVPSYAAVVDTVGTDVEAVASNLEKYKNAVYVSTMPATLRKMQAQGLLGGASLFSSIFFGTSDVATTNIHWIPEKAGLEVIQYVFKLVEAKALSVSHAPPTGADYMDGVLWPRDAETNARFGFPAAVPEDSFSDLLERYRNGQAKNTEYDL